MTRIETILGYHGTTKINADNIYKTQLFIPNEDKTNALFLGRGVYFYPEKNDAVFWNINSMLKENKLVEYNRYKMDYSVVEVLMECKEDEILDLDNIENYLNFQIYLESVNEKLVNSDFYKRAKNKDAALINYMEKHGALDGIKIIKKTFFQNNKVLDKIKICRVMFCIKDEKIIKEIMISSEISEDVFNIIYKASFGKYRYV